MGGGIQDAMQAAQIAAKTAIKALEGEDCSKKRLMEYQTTWFKEYGNVQALQYKLMNALSCLTDDDYDYYIRNFKPEYINKMWHSNGIMELLKIMMKRPNLKSIVSGVFS